MSPVNPGDPVPEIGDGALWRPGGHELIAVKGACFLDINMMYDSRTTDGQSRFTLQFASDLAKELLKHY